MLHIIEKNIGNNLDHICTAIDFAIDFLNSFAFLAQSLNKQLTKGPSKLKSFCTAKDTVIQTKWQCTEEGNNF